MPPGCGFCGLRSTFACSGCYTAYYCDPICQAKMWRTHKPLCAPAAAKARMRAKGSTPLHLCAEESCTESLGLMLHLGIGSEMRDRQGLTALMAAAVRGKADSLAVLLDGGASITAAKAMVSESPRPISFTAMTFACLYSSSAEPGAPARALACMRLLVERGAKCSEVDAIVASKYGTTEIVALVAANR
jgi:hypothetical protein